MMANPKVLKYTLTPDRPCYKQFFVGGQPPVGLRRNEDTEIRDICQPPKLNQDPLQTYYATMFDERYGLAVFSAYKLSKGDEKFQKWEGKDWCETPGNLFRCMQPSVKLPVQGFSASLFKSGPSQFGSEKSFPELFSLNYLKW